MKKPSLTKVQFWMLFGVSILICLILTISIFIMLLNDYGASFVAVGSTLLMIFSYQEKSKLIRYRNLVAGYWCTGIISAIGILYGASTTLSVALAFIGTIGIMIIFDIVHAPALPFVLSFMFQKLSITKIGIVLLATTMLILMAKTTRHVLKAPDTFYTQDKKETIKFKFKKKERPPTLHFIDRLEKY